MFTEEDLFVTDTFSFGTQIGQITNTCSTICALIPTFPEGSKERITLENRLKAGCAAQSRQIDKTKIGENVKTLGTVCKQFQHITQEDSEEEIEQKMFYNKILADKKPYFFRYKYNFLNKEYNEYVKKNNENAQIRFACTLNELLLKEKQGESLTEEQQTFLMYYRKFMPVVDSDCVMNKICKYIENVDFKIKQKIKSNSDFDYKTLLSQNFSVNKKLYAEIREVVVNTVHEWQDSIKYEKVNNIEKNTTAGLSQKKYEKDVQMQILKEKLENICSNEEQLKNHLVYLFYEDKPSLNKTILWSLVGKSIYEDLSNRTNYFYFPIKNENGTLEFLYENYSIERIAMDKVIND